jgi:hypothetical protein
VKAVFKGERRRVRIFRERLAKAECRNLELQRMLTDSNATIAEYREERARRDKGRDDLSRLICGLYRELAHLGWPMY